MFCRSRHPPNPVWRLFHIAGLLVGNCQASPHQQGHCVATLHDEVQLLHTATQVLQSYKVPVLFGTAPEMEGLFLSTPIS